jgi:outer membrane protein assembly factor BamB
MWTRATRVIVALLAVATLLAVETIGFGQDAGPATWPGWRGPQRNGISLETGWATRWPPTAAKVLWKASVGKGFSAFAVANGCAYTIGNAGGQDTVFCLDAESGAIRWRHSYNCSLTPLAYEGGPSATPLVDGNRVYTLSKAGHLFCLDAATGQVVWSREFPAAPRKEGDYFVDWGYAASPLVWGPRLFLSVGWAGMALDKNDGKLLWDNGVGRAGYSSPVPFTLGQQACLALLVARGVVLVEADGGRILSTVPWRTTWDQNAPDVVVSDQKLFVSTGHGVGCALFDITQTPPQELWRNKNMRNELSSSVLWQGSLYGFDRNRLTCLDWQTGQIRWSQPGLGQGTLILVDGRLIVLSDRGKLVMADANPTAFKQLWELPLGGFMDRFWSAPAFCDGKIFVRNSTGSATCVDVRK